MADFKTAEQYVVERLEDKERECELAKIAHKSEMSKVLNDIEKTKVELHSAYELLNMMRDFIEVRRDSYLGNYISVDDIYSSDNAELVARITEYYDIRPEEDDDE